jgi:hypothetical protein
MMVSVLEVITMTAAAVVMTTIVFVVKGAVIVSVLPMSWMIIAPL